MQPSFLYIQHWELLLKDEVQLTKIETSAKNIVRSCRVAKESFDNFKTKLSDKNKIAFAKYFCEVTNDKDESFRIFSNSGQNVREHNFFTEYDI